MNSLSNFISLSTPLVERLGWVLIHSAWQFTLVGLLAAVIIRLMRSNSSRARYGVLVVLLLVSVGFPVATWLLQPQSSTQVANTLTPVTVETPDSVVVPSVAQESSCPEGAASAPLVVASPDIALQPELLDQAVDVVAVLPIATPQRPWLQRGAELLRPWLTWLVAAWVVGVAFFMLRPTWGWLTLRRLKRTGTTPVSPEIEALLTGVATHMGLQQSVSVLKSSLAQVPMVVGYIRPVVLLPASLLTSLPVSQLEAILAHELAHIRRHDFVVNLVQTLIETLFFYHPAMWWLSRRIRVEREHCCDDLVIDAMDNRTEYGRALVAIEELRGVNPVLSLSASDGSLLARIRRIANPKRQQASVSPWLGVFVLTCLVGVILTLGSVGNSEALAMSEGETQDTSQPIEDDDKSKTSWPPVDSIAFLEQLRLRDAQFNSRSLRVERRWKERVDPQAVLAAQRRETENEIPAPYDQPHRVEYVITGDGFSPAIDNMADRESAKHPRYAGVVAAKRWPGFGGMVFNETIFRGQVSQERERQLKRKSFQWTCGYGFAEWIDAIDSMIIKGNKLVITGRLKVPQSYFCYYSEEESERIEKAKDTFEIEIDRNLVVRRAVFEIAAVPAFPVDHTTPDGDRYQRFVVETNGLVRPSNSPAVAAGGRYQVFVQNTKVADKVLYDETSIFLGISDQLTEVELKKRQSPNRDVSNLAPGKLDNGPAANRVAATRFNSPVERFTGRVLKPDGTPSAGARVYLVPENGDSRELGKMRAETGADGRFDFTAPDMVTVDIDGLPSRRQGRLIATAADFAADAIAIKTRGSNNDFELQLATDLPIRGRLLDQQGKPVESATVTVSRIEIPKPRNLDEYLKREANRSLTSTFLTRTNFNRSLGKPDLLPGVTVKVRTATDGSFTVSGIGRERLAYLAATAPGFAPARITVMTRDAPDVGTMLDFEGNPTQVIHGANFKSKMSTGETVSGRVVDHRTGKPIAGMLVGLGNRFPQQGKYFTQLTDADGRFQINGLYASPKKGYTITAAAQPGMPHLPSVVTAKAGTPITIECRRGIPFRMALIDETGQPISLKTKAEVSVVGIANFSNKPLAGQLHPADMPSLAVRTNDGSYRGYVMPGNSAVVVTMADSEYARTHVEPKTIFIKPTDSDLRELHRKFLTHNYAAVVPVQATPDSGPLELKATIFKVPPRQVRLVDANGEPVIGVTMRRGEAHADKLKLRSATFPLLGLHRDHDQFFMFTHKERGLVGVLAARGDADTPYTVQMLPRVTAIGRIFELEGDVPKKLGVMFIDNNYPGSRFSAKLDGAGRFRAERLIPGQSYRVETYRVNSGDFEAVANLQNVILKPGETRDLGDIQRGKGQRGKAAVDDTAKQMEPTPVWGKPDKGIRVAARYRLGDQRAEIAGEYTNRVFPNESRVDIEYLIQNVSQKPIEIEMPTWLQEIPTFRVLDGKEERLAGTWYSGITPTESHTLMPKQIVAIPAIGVGFSKDQAKAVFDHPIGSVIGCEPGKVRLRHELTVKLSSDAIEATASTGVTSLTIRDRTPKDNPPTFPVTLKFKNPDGSFADSGFVRVNHTGRRKILFEGELSGASLTVPGCTAEALSVYRRLPGCVATTDRDVKPDPDTPVVLGQTASDPIRFRLVDPDGTPVRDAVVRLFNIGGTKTSSNAYPTKGIKGEVYGRSDSDGNVIVDHVTSENDHASQGDRTYFFYIQPKKLAPTFIGPVEAGAALGDIAVGPLLEVSGEIHGTPEQLRNFKAEWDQPVEMRRGDGTVGQYAVSKRLQVKREGNKAVVKLTNLRPGTLRIVSRFFGGSKSYSSGRLIAGPNDVVLEIDLTESRHDLVIKPRGAEPQDDASEGDNPTQ